MGSIYEDLSLGKSRYILIIISRKSEYEQFL